MPLYGGWKRELDQASGGANGALSVTIGSNRLYLFDEYGRISTSTGAGATLEFPTTYTRGEALELRYRSTYTASQFQGMFMQVRSDVANTSAIRAIELEARQGANGIALGELTGIIATAFVNSATTGTVTTARGGHFQVSMNASYTGTVTSLYGVHIKIQNEDGATVTTGYGLYIEEEDVTGTSSGTARLDAAIGIKSTSATAGVFRYGIDSTATEFTNGSANEVVLWAFKGANGTTYYLVHDTDAATVLGVVTTDPTT